jgi:hypothetical protein
MRTEKLIARSLRLIQVIDPNQSVRASDMETGIDALNGLMRRFEANGLAMGWQAVSNPSDELPMPEEAQDAIAYALAVRLSSEYGVTPMPAVVQTADGLMNDLRRDQMVATPIQPILGVPTPDNWNGATLNGESWYAG